jgi:hypothetical protein
LCVALGGVFAAHLKAQQDHLNSTAGITYDEIRQMQDFKQTGERDAVAANVLFGLGAATLVGAAVLSYFDYRRARAEARAAPSLRVGLGSVSVHTAF